MRGKKKENNYNEFLLRAHFSPEVIQLHVVDYTLYLFI